MTTCKICDSYDADIAHAGTLQDAMTMRDAMRLHRMKNHYGKGDGPAPGETVTPMWRGIALPIEETNTEIDSQVRKLLDF